MREITFTFDELKSEFLELFFFARKRKLYSKNPCDAEDAIENYIFDRFFQS